MSIEATNLIEVTVTDPHVTFLIVETKSGEKAAVHMHLLPKGLNKKNLYLQRGDLIDLDEFILARGIKVFNLSKTSLFDFMKGASHAKTI